MSDREDKIQRTCIIYVIKYLPEKEMGSSFLLICKLALTMFPSLAPPVAFNSVMVKFSMSSGILNKKKKKFKQRNVSQLRITCTLKFSLQFTSSGTEKRVRFFWYSPSLKVMVP